MSEETSVVVVGAWHLGSVIGCCLAEVGAKCFLWDQSQKVNASWTEGKIPVHEPGLQDLATKHWGKNLFWVKEKEFVSVVEKANWILLAYDTPVNDQDEVVFDSVEEGFDKVLTSGFSNDVHFFFTAQLPVGTSQRFLFKIKEKNPLWKGFIFYMPENLRLGDAIKSFKSPDRMVIGISTTSEESRSKAVKFFRDLIKDQETPINVMSLESAEMVKHALNAFLGTCVVFANEVSEICETSGADAWDVMGSLKQDSRVGPKAFLRPGLGFSGGTLARDVKTLSKLTSKKKKVSFFSDLYDVNQARNDWVAAQLMANLSGCGSSLEGKRVVLMGVTYKPFTSTVRRSPALEIGYLLKKLGASCVALDPMADIKELSEKERNDLPFEILETADEAFTKADACVVVTEWPQFLDYDFLRLKEKMKTSLVVDSKNMFASHVIHKFFKVIVPGKPFHA